jgi:hypothetical protein
VLYQTILVIIRGSSGGKETNLPKNLPKLEKSIHWSLLIALVGVKKKPRSARKPPTNRFGKVA